MHNPQHDYTELYNAFTAFIPAGELFEVRLLNRNSKKIDSGYFDRPEEAATAIAALQEPYAGIYFTPNAVNPDLAARAYNRIMPWATITSTDPDIVRRRWLPIDVDPDRPSGISSTDAELANSFKVVSTIANMLEFEGWPKPRINLSGNGCHAFYPVDLPNTEEVRDEIHTFLKLLDGRFKSDGCSIDPTVFNAARIMRVPGTWARKGDDIPTRPHRKAYMVSAPPFPATVSLARIRQFNQDNAKYAKVTPLRPGVKLPLEYPGDEQVYRGLNQKALERGAPQQWVPQFFPAARAYKDGYRVASSDLNMPYEEDLTIHPWPMGIKYFGVADQDDPTEGRRTPVSIIAEFVTEGSKPVAAQKLASALQMPLSEFDIIQQPVMVQGLDSGPGPANLPGIVATAPQYDFKRVPNAADLQKKTFKAPVWIIPDILPAGSILLSARPKMRKTFLALQLALAVVGGRKFLDWQVNQSDVLFLGLEDTEQRIQSRIKLLQTYDLNPPDMTGLRYWTAGVDISPTSGRAVTVNEEEQARFRATWPQGEAGVKALEDFLDMYPRTKLIIIDTYARFRGQSTNRDIYQRDYDQMVPITALCARREICCLIIHHDKKGLAGTESGDFLEDASGTAGLTGAVDGGMSIKGRRGMQDSPEERTLQLTGRDIPHDIKVDIKFDAQRGGWLPAARQDLRVSILKMLTIHPFMTQLDIAAAFSHVPKARVTQVLAMMKLEGLLRHDRTGYSIPNDFKGD